MNKTIIIIVSRKLIVNDQSASSILELHWLQLNFCIPDNKTWATIELNLGQRRRH